MVDKTDEEYAIEAIALTKRLLAESTIPENYWKSVGQIVAQVYAAGMIAGAEVSRTEFKNVVKRHTERN